MQSILESISPFNPQKAAEIADKILDISPSQISVVSESSIPNLTLHAELLKEVKLLRKKVAPLRRFRSGS